MNVYKHLRFLYIVGLKKNTLLLLKHAGPRKKKNKL